MTNYIDDFHKALYDSGVWLNTKWLGIPVLKMPFDLHVYQEIIYEIQPDIIVETGTYNGGSALYFASILDLIGKGRVFSVDISLSEDLPKHSRIEYVQGSSVANDVLSHIRSSIKREDVVMVTLDSNHSRNHVLAELNAYHEFVSMDSYLIVEDTNINGHPVYPDFGPGPMEAVQTFLHSNDQFVSDTSRHKFFLSFHPNGFLKRIRVNTGQ